MRFLFLSAAILLASQAAAQDTSCKQAKNLSANYWTMVGALSAILETCEEEKSRACKIAEKADEMIKEQGAPNGTLLLMGLSMEMCRE